METPREIDFKGAVEEFIEQYVCWAHPNRTGRVIQAVGVLKGGENTGLSFFFKTSIFLYGPPCPGIQPRPGWLQTHRVLKNNKYFTKYNYEKTGLRQCDKSRLYKKGPYIWCVSTVSPSTPKTVSYGPAFLTEGTQVAGVRSFQP